ncbi:MAG TPA: phosphoglycolate phosphatase [Burkholderiaceae bacterium]|nr:phosphoglycolate phosphatase [Burkholderiaceae bacterium]
MTFLAALFDLDGTLLDTLDDLTDAVNAMRADYGQPALTRAVVETYVGKGTDYLVMRSLAHDVLNQPPTPDDISEALKRFTSHYRRLCGDRATLYPGVVEGLAAFRDRGLKLAVVTNKPTEFTGPLLEHMGIAHFFEHLVCGDTCARKKPDPMPFLHACSLLGVEPGSALAVGDSINDAQAARAAGITVLAVPYGYRGGQDVRTLPVDGIVTSIENAAHWAAQHQERSPS